MTKAELLSLSRDELIARAREAGVAEPEAKTRADLVDALAKLVEPAQAPAAAEPPAQKPRGFFGRARALIARVIEKGLHLPTPATFRDNVREETARAPLPTVTLARIYLSQGHPTRAAEVLRDVLARDPRDAEATELLASIDAPRDVVATASVAPTPTSSTLAGPAPIVAPSAAVAPPVVSEPRGALVEVAPPPALVASGGSGPKPMLDDTPLPDRYDVDEAIVMSVDPTTAYVYWEIRPETKRALRAQAPHGRLVVRLSLGFDGREARRDIYPDTDIGDVFVDELPDGARIRATLGFLVDDVFTLLSRGPATTSPPATMATRLADSLASWTPEHTEMLQGPLPAAVALSIALAHTTDPSLRPQLDVLARVPGFRLVDDGAGGADDELGASPSDDDNQAYEHEARAVLLGLGLEDGPSRAGEPRRARRARAPLARTLALGSSDLLTPLGSSEALLRAR